MPILHTVNKSPFERPAVESCTRYALPGSAILLIEDGVYAARAGARVQAVLEALTDVRIFALGPDLQARGIQTGDLFEAVTVVDYDGFVNLAVEHDKIQSWL